MASDNPVSVQDVENTVSAPGKQNRIVAKFLNPSVAASPDATGTREWKIWAASFVVWTLLALLSMAGSSLYYLVAGGTPPPWKFLVGISFTDAYVWALLTPLIYRLAVRYSFDSRECAPACVFHAVSVFAFALFAAFATAALNWTFHLIRNGAPIGMRAESASLFLENLPRYCLVVAVAQALLYYERLQQRRLQSSRLEAQLAHAQLQNLKMQLQPHFLFNVLNSIAALCRNDPPAAEKMTLQLSELLRLSLQSADLHQVPLRRELELLDCYLRIQQTRFRDRLCVQFDVDSSAMDAAVPTLLLQPLVENAVRHGISPRLGPGRITVQGKKHGDWLDLEIVDDGVGSPHGSSETPGEGVGLSNTRGRLHQLYGDNCEFICENLLKGGFRVGIRLPFRVLPAVPSRCNL
jgi:hypothetical protein